MYICIYLDVGKSLNVKVKLLNVFLLKSILYYNNLIVKIIR